MDLVLRPARPEECDWFFATRRDAFRIYAEQVFGPWDDVLHRGYADRDFAELPVELVEQAGAVVGYQIVLRHDDHWVLDEIALVGSARNRGLGTALVTALTAAAPCAWRPGAAIGAGGQPGAGSLRSLGVPRHRDGAAARNSRTRVAWPNIPGSPTTELELRLDSATQDATNVRLDTKGVAFVAGYGHGLATTTHMSLAVTCSG